jgi:cell division protein FtsB
MSIGREIKRRVKAAIPPLAFAALTAYFAWAASHGDRGLQAYAHRQSQLLEAQADLTKSQTELEMWERRVSSLRTSRLDPDSLDEQARATLNLADPADIIVMYGPGKRLF